MPESSVEGKSVKRKSGVGFQRNVVNALGIRGWDMAWLETFLVSRLASGIAGLVYQPVVDLSLENKVFPGKRK